MPEDNETPTVAATVPGLLARFTDDRRTVSLRAATVEECVDRLVETYPDLESHLFDERGQLRTHVKLYHAGTGVAWPEGGAIELADGDEVTFLQAVSGG